MVTTFVSVKAGFEALHRWPGAPDSESYLRHPHRHWFAIELEISTDAARDREIEVNHLARALTRFCGTLGTVAAGFGPHGSFIVSLGTQSCEVVATQIVRWADENWCDEHRARYIVCRVLEDGILGAGAEFHGIPS